MKKTLLIFSMIFFAIFLNACAQKDVLTYEGEGANWRVIYTITNTSEDSYDYYLQYYYKGDKQELKKFDEITFRFETPIKSGGGPIPTIILNLDDKNKAVFESGGYPTNMNLLNEDPSLNIFSAFIAWGDTEEFFELVFID